MSGPRPVPEALGEWRRVAENHRQFLLTSPEGHAVHHVAQQVINVLAAEIASLRDVIDHEDNRQVIYCAERDKDTMIAQSPDVLAGTVLRATDTLREWVYMGSLHGWQEREERLLRGREGGEVVTTIKSTSGMSVGEILVHWTMIICTFGMWYPVYRARKHKADRTTTTVIA